MQQIVVTLNGSQLGEAILPHAIVLAHATCSRITLLRTITPPRSYLPCFMSMTIPCNWYDNEEEWTRQYLNNVARYIRHQGVEARAIMLEGDPATNIIAYASHEPNVLLIAMASHGRQGAAERWLLGSVSTRVVQAMPRPVLLLHPISPEAAHLTPIPAYQNIIIPLDGSPRGERVLDFARPLARRFESTVTLVQAAPASTGKLQIGSGSEYIREKARQLSAAHVIVRTQVSIGDPLEFVQQLSCKQQNVLVMGTQRDGGLVMKFIHRVGVPVLLIPARENV